jgi:hypothetical protein
VTWWYRVIELDDGHWVCRFGLVTFDGHDALADAVEHCSTLAASNQPSEVFVHHLGAAPQSVVAFP